jgi:hypothetical protein
MATLVHAINCACVRSSGPVRHPPETRKQLRATAVPLVPGAERTCCARCLPARLPVCLHAPAVTTNLPLDQWRPLSAHVLAEVCSCCRHRSCRCGGPCAQTVDSSVTPACMLRQQRGGCVAAARWYPLFSAPARSCGAVLPSGAFPQGASRCGASPTTRHNQHSARQSSDTGFSIEPAAQPEQRECHSEARAWHS